MEIEAKIKIADYKRNLWAIQLKDPQTNSTIVTGRCYESEEEAELAKALLVCMFSRYTSRAEFDVSLYDYYIRTILRIIESPNKW